MLKAQGTKITDNGREIKLRGYCVGNWLMMENFMMGFPGVEQQFRGMFKKYAGEEKSACFLDRLMDNYFSDADAAYLKELGCNVIRLPFNYRHLEDDHEPFKYKADGFKYLDKAVQICKAHGIYVILDMHAAPGYQNDDWHSDNFERKTRLYDDEIYQKRFAELWRHIAGHYRGEETVAAYDLLNEPVARGDAQVAALDRLYKQTAAAIREADPEHMIVVRGNYWGQNFDGFSAPFMDNLLYACHFYTDAALQQIHYPAFERSNSYGGGRTLDDKTVLEAKLRIRDRFITGHGVPCWVSEFGIFEDNCHYHESKMDALRDQLDLFNAAGHHWTVWSYKDVGNMGIVRPRRDTPWVALTDEIIRLKKKYNCDYNTDVSERWPLSSRIKEYVGNDFGEDYERVRNRWELSLTMVFNDMLAEQFAKRLAGFSIKELEGLADSFRFENCDRMPEWEDIVKKALAGNC